jgi:hypothetical protein
VGCPAPPVGFGVDPLFSLFSIPHTWALSACRYRSAQMWRILLLYILYLSTLTFTAIGTSAGSCTFAHTPLLLTVFTVTLHSHTVSVCPSSPSSSSNPLRSSSVLATRSLRKLFFPAHHPLFSFSFAPSFVHVLTFSQALGFPSRGISDPGFVSFVNRSGFVSFVNRPGFVSFVTTYL